MSIGRSARRPNAPEVLFAAAVVIAVAMLLWLGQGLTFFADEWAVIEGRHLDLDSFIRPFNEHWLGTTVLVYRALFELVGLVTYVPYLAFLVGLHVIVAIEAFVLVRRGAGSWLALGAGVVVLLFGSGFENLYWAMQIGFVGATALGLAAMLLLEPRPSVVPASATVPASAASTRPSAARIGLATILLTLAVSTSGLGLAVLAAVGLELIVDPRRRSWAIAAVIPAGVYAIWYVALGQRGIATHANPFSLEALQRLPSFVIEGAGVTAGAVFGVGPALGLLVGTAIVGLVIWLAATGRGVPPRTIGCLGAIVTLYALTGLVRSQLEGDAALYTRYSYLSGILLIVGLAPLAGRAVKSWPSVPRRRLLAGGIVAVLFALALTWNVALLVQGRQIFAERADRTRALVTVALGPLPAGVEAERTLILIPSPESVRRLVDRYGSPLSDPFVISGLGPIPADALADARRRLAERKGVLGPLPQ